MIPREWLKEEDRVESISSSESSTRSRNICSSIHSLYSY